MNHSYPKVEKLKSKKLIEQLFSEGRSITVFPLRLIYLEITLPENAMFQVGVSVSKRNIKSAVQRNRIKRLLREAYRLNKSMLFNNITTQKALMILYIGSDIPNYKTLDTRMKLLFERFLIKDSKT